MKNAKEEFLYVTRNRKVKCAEINYSASSLWELNDEQAPPPKELILKVGHTSEELEEFINQLDFDYDSGYGGQELFGRVWFDDDGWMDRGEYDGSEWWHLHYCPSIPEELRETVERT